MELTISEEQAKDLLKEALVELIEEKRDLFYEVMLEVIEEVGLAKAIREGRQDEFVSEEQVLALRGIRDRALLERVEGVIQEIKTASALSEVKHLTKMRGYTTFYRLRLGDYRIGIEVVEGEVIL